MFKQAEKKIIALLLAICMLLLLLPYTAEAEELTPQAAPSDEAAEITPEPLEPDCRILSYVDEAVFRAGNHVARLPAEETLSSYVFLNTDGTRTVYYMDEAVKYVDSGGNILEKDVTLTAALDGYATTQNDVTLSLPADPATGIRMNWNGHTVSILPQGGSLSQPQTLEGNSVKYPNYFGQGIDLVYTPTLSGLKEDIILSSYTGVNTFTFMLNTGGLNLYQANGRYYLAESKAAAERIDLGDLVSFDATGRFSLGTVTTQTVMAGNIYRLTLTVDEAFLTDPNTVYPVSIDPTLTVSDNTHGAGAIEDVSIYSGTPNMNAGSWTYNHCGYYDSTYKVARTLFRLSGLISDATYKGVPTNGITSAEFHIREATGSAGLPVYLYANIGSSTWTESGATWNNSGLTLGTKYATASPASNTDTVYDITQLLKDWRSGTQTAAKGFVLVSSNETSKDKAFYASEYSTTSYRPYVVVNYDLNDITITIDEGVSQTLSTSGITGTITWKSSNTAVATVNSSGVVTGVRAGSTTVTATVSGTLYRTYYINVTIADGVYYIKNNLSNFYLEPENAGVASGTDVQQRTYKTSDPGRLAQLWKITYISNGYYSIRPMHRLTTALYANGSVLDIRTVNTTDSLTYITANYRWTITYKSSGYVIQNGGSSSKTLYPSGSSTASDTDIALGTYSSSSSAYLWTFSEPTSTVHNRIQFYDHETKTLPYLITRSISPGETLTLNHMNVSASFVSKTTNTQNITWHVTDPTVAYVDETTGTVTGIKPGSSTTIVAKQTYKSTTHSSSTYCTFRINVEVDPVEGYTILPSRILYDSTCPYSEEELKEFYAQATYDFLTKFHIIFALYDISSTTSFELSTTCYAGSNGYLCTEECSPLDKCGTQHHRSAYRLLTTEQSSSYYTCRIVGHTLCSYGDSGHSGKGGLSFRNGRDIVGSTYGTGLPGLIQHELAHNMGALDLQCTEGQLCVMSSAGLGYWCDNCIAIINAKF